MLLFLPSFIEMQLTCSLVALPYKPCEMMLTSEFMCFPVLLFCSVLFLFSFLTVPCRVWDLGLLTRNRTCTACIGNWKRGVNHRLPRSPYLAPFHICTGFSDSPCFFHQTLRALSAFYCRLRPIYCLCLCLRILLLSSAWPVVSYCIFSFT